MGSNKPFAPWNLPTHQYQNPYLPQKLTRFGYFLTRCGYFLNLSIESFFSPCNSSFFLFIDWMLASILSHPHHLRSSSEPKTHVEGNRRENLLVFPISIIPSFLNNFNNTVQVASWKYLLCCCQVKEPVGRALPSTSAAQCLKVMPVGNCGAGNLSKPCGTRDCVPYRYFSTHSAGPLG